MRKGGYDMGINIGQNVVISPKAKIGNNTVIGCNCIVEDNVIIGDNVNIESNSCIRNGTEIADDSYIGSNCVIGEHQEYMNGDSIHVNEENLLVLGKKCLIRSGSIIYSNSVIGDYFQTGHNVTIRENTRIGDNVSIGTLSDIQGDCCIGHYVRLHSNVHVGKASVIDGFNWIYPYVCLTNDPTPPSEVELGVHVHRFAIIATGSVILPGIDIAEDSLVAAGAAVTKNVRQYDVVAGNPAKHLADIRTIINRETGETNYPWRYRFNRMMPWSKDGFEKWYNELSETEKLHYGY